MQVRHHLRGGPHPWGDASFWKLIPFHTSDEKLLMQLLLSNIKCLTFSDSNILTNFLFYIICSDIVPQRSSLLYPTSSTPPTSCGLSSWTPQLVGGGRRSTTSLRVSTSSAFALTFLSLILLWCYTSDISCQSKWCDLPLKSTEDLTLEYLWNNLENYSSLIIDFLGGDFGYREDKINELLKKMI